MNSITIICSLAEIRNELIPLLKKEFSVSEGTAEDLFDYDILPHFQQLKPGIYFLLESPYVDRIYRDSYYSYFSTKLGNYKKDCIKISLFEGEIFPEDFRDTERIYTVTKRYMGFMVLRPTIPGIIGRNVISPQALLQNNFLSLSSSFHSTVNAVKFEARGFPHSSQDSETITCAETALWAIMEYFAAKYPDYKPVLPSTIVSALKSRAVERQIPSKGLYVDQLGYAIKEFGFGSRIYAKEEFGENDFKSMISTYVESGLPLICSISNEGSGGSIAHAILAIGHSKTGDDQIRTLQLTDETDPYLIDIMQQNSISLFDNDDIERDFVFIDDNQPAYQLASLNSPAVHYNDTDWHSCEITHFIVPLYPKIYLEAYEAKSYFKELLFSSLFKIANGSQLFIRMFLTSSRSYKDILAKDQTYPALLKAYILETPMPKFIWIGEISTKALISRQLAHGLLILDATEPNLQNFNGLISISYQDSYYYPDNNTKELTRISLTLDPFNIYTNNLNGF